MPASYPNSVKIFTTKTTGQTILASHINEPQDEITAIEQGLLQGLAHALFPNTDVGQDLGTATKRWRQLLVQKIASGITNATRLRVQEVGTSTWITVNADFDGTNWNREDTAQPAQAIEINSAKEVKYYRAVAGANPITWTNVFTISTDKITASQAVIGTDPGGTEVLRVQNLRAGAATITADLAVAGNALQGARSDRGMIDFESDWNMYTDAGVYAVRQWTGTPVNAPPATYGYGMLIVERFGTVGLTQIYIPHRPEHDPHVYVRQLWPGSTWTEWRTLAFLDDIAALDTRFVNVTGDSMTGTLSAPTVVAGIDPGGTESLRAGSARLNAPVLLGSVPQFTMAANPTAALQVATKQYVDNRTPSLSELDARYVNVTGDTMTGALVVGTDPGGTELLRAQSLRAGSGRVGSWRILGVINVTSNTTSVQFSSLNISPPAVLRLHWTIVNGASSFVDYHLRVNGETNSLDWASQFLAANGTTVSANRLVDVSSIASIQAGARGSVHTSICITGGGLVTAVSVLGRMDASDTPVLVVWCASKNTSITSLSSIEVVATATNGIGAGSVLMLEYLAP